MTQPKLTKEQKEKLEEDIKEAKEQLANLAYYERGGLKVDEHRKAFQKIIEDNQKMLDALG